MRSRQLSENLTQLSKLGLVNAYLVLEEDGLTLVDTAMNAAGELIDAATALGQPIRRIALTHGHGDHAGSLDQLCRRLGRAAVTVLMPAVDARILSGETPDLPGRKRGSWPKLETKPDVLLEPGDVLGSLEVVACPGHTPGQVAFLDRRDRSLIAGDAFTAMGRLEVTSHITVRFPLAAFATWDRAQALRSALALRALEPALLALGHGHAVSAPVAEMDAAIARAQRAA
jgi:glyoxylase-like metal-dependent hydrolase (beta-lactamase superfamily II)